ncbi:hypothetical protein QFZ40_001442 [Arthrobacter pascens]|uniref:hypothetical protein n=1 Tax=Arthrobacter pascens TaxID=1677 RepID=UPI002787910A|nr:hypothetical protein [Arthrobacter pascens]MDQ0633533.1 hypothetical protein [Arthrobacter pascens]
MVETDQPPGCPSCSVIASRRKERRLQRLRDIPVAGPVKVLWSKYRSYRCEETACDRLSFFESPGRCGAVRARPAGSGTTSWLLSSLWPGRFGDSRRVRRVLVDGPGGAE